MTDWLLLFVIDWLIFLFVLYLVGCFYLCYTCHGLCTPENSTIQKLSIIIISAFEQAQCAVLKCEFL